MKTRLPKPFYSKKSSRGVLLLHAYSGSANDVRMLARALEKENYTVYAPILTGHGTPDPLDILAASVSDWQHDVRQAVAKLKDDGVSQLAVFGLSMGGILAMDLLTSDEEILAGGAFCSPLFPSENQVTKSFLDYSKYLYQKQELPAAQLTEKLQTIEQKQPQQLVAIEALGFQVARRLPELRRPVYVAQGGKDEMIDPTTAYETLRALSKTDVSFHWFAKSGHVITVSEEHQQFENTVGQFIENLPWNEEKW